MVDLSLCVGIYSFIVLSDCIFKPRIFYMYKYFLFSILFLVGCSNQPTNYKRAENAFDAGREFIDAGLKGDFLKANFYMLPNEKNTQFLAVLEREYRAKDKEGRQLFRTASINIQQVEDIDSVTNIISYSFSFNKQLKRLKIVKSNNQWLVDYQYSFTTP